MSNICKTHKKQFESFCVSNKCRSQHSAICSHPQCLLAHQHPIKQTLSIEKVQNIIIDACFPLNQLVTKIKQYFILLKKELFQKIERDEERLLDIVRRYEYCEQPDNYEILLNIIDKRYSCNTSSQIIKLYETLTDPNRRERIKQSVNKYQSQLTMKNINKLFNSDLYKEIVLNRFGTRSQSIQSKILNKKQENLLFELLKKQSINLTFYKQIFRAKDHKFSAQEYHKHVDNITPTLTIIKANNHVFGNFLNSKISNTSTWVPDSSKKSFIFSLDHQTIHKLIDSKQTISKAAFGGKQGPQIGSGLDIYICDKCDQVKRSGSSLGGSYELPFGMQFKSQKAQNYLCGQRQFYVQDYEIFTLI